jgi:hypothetical protein
MAISKPHSKDTSSNSSGGLSFDYDANASIKATCYIVDSSSMTLNAFHYSATGAGGPEWYS